MQYIIEITVENPKSIHDYSSSGYGSVKIQLENIPDMSSNAIGEAIIAASKTAVKRFYDKQKEKEIDTNAPIG